MITFTLKLKKFIVKLIFYLWTFVFFEKNEHCLKQTLIFLKPKLWVFTWWSQRPPLLTKKIYDVTLGV